MLHGAEEVDCKVGKSKNNKRVTPSLNQELNSLRENEWRNKTMGPSFEKQT